MYSRGIYDGIMPRPIGGLAPIPATDEMTHPVGVRDGQLFTTPTSGLPEPVEGDEGKVAQIVSGAWAKSSYLPNAVSALQTQMIEALATLEIHGQKLDEIYTNLVELREVLRDINAGRVGE